MKKLLILSLLFIPLLASCKESYFYIPKNNKTYEVIRKEEDKENYKVLLDEQETTFKEDYKWVIVSEDKYNSLEVGQKLKGKEFK